VIRKVVRRLGVEAARRLSKASVVYRVGKKLGRAMPESLQETYGSGQVAAKLASFAAHKRKNGVTFVQIGSNDGVTGDPIHFYVKRDRWTGVLVEPVPGPYASLIANYREQSGLQFLNVAVADFDGETTFHHVDNLEDAPFWADQIGSLDRAVIQKHESLIDNLESRVVSTSVPCMTMKTLLSTCGIHSFDLLHIDAEGADLSILQQIDFTRHRPQIVLYEHIHLSDEGVATARRLLENFDYELFVEGRNTLACRKT
jgi:FkbM family methyltransferase